MNPRLGRNFEAMDPLDWLARLQDHIPDPGKHRVHFFCRKCGGKIRIVAYVHDTVAIRRILDHLGLSPPEDPKPPPAGHQVVRVPVDEEGREIATP